MGAFANACKGYVVHCCSVFIRTSTNCNFAVVARQLRYVHVRVVWLTGWLRYWIQLGVHAPQLSCLRVVLQQQLCGI